MWIEKSIPLSLNMRLQEDINFQIVYYKLVPEHH